MTYVYRYEFHKNMSGLTDKLNAAGKEGFRVSHIIDDLKCDKEAVVTALLVKEIPDEVPQKKKSWWSL